jgi:glyoxylate reductase
MRPKVFVTRLIPEAGLQPIHAACDAEVWPHQMPPSRDELRARLADCDGVVALLTDPFDAAMLDAAPKLRVISNFAVGFNNVDVPAATARGIAVGNTPGVLTDATADLAFALLIAAARCLRQGHEHIVAGQWKTWEPLGYLGQDLTGRTLGIVGLGRIGTALAQRCRGGWGMKVLYSNPRRNEEAERELGATFVDLDTLLRTSDFVSLHCPLTAETRGLMGREQFRTMKRTAVLVNTARGPLVDESALLEALKEGTIFAAGLDVTDPEPPRPDDPLLFQPNLVIAPHVGSATHSARAKMAEMAAANLLAGLEGKPLPNWVNPEVAANWRKG